MVLTPRLFQLLFEPLPHSPSDLLSVSVHMASGEKEGTFVSKT